MRSAFRYMFYLRYFLIGGQTEPSLGDARCGQADYVLYRVAVDLSDMDGDVCDRAFQRAHAKTLLALLLSHQANFVEHAATLLGDRFKQNRDASRQPNR
jgi:hypothetical protein